MDVCSDNEDLLLEALNLQKKGELQEAQDLYEKIINEEPDNYVALHFCGLLCSQNAQNDEAIGYLIKSFELNPCEDYLHDLTNICSAYNKRVVAIECYKKMLKFLPDNVKLIYELGLLYFQEELYVEAINLAKSNLELFPDSFELNDLLGMVLHHCGHLDLASTFYRKSYEIKPNNYKVLEELGRVYYDKYEYEKALKYFNLALEYNPDNINLLNLIALSYQELENLPESIKFYEKARKLAPTNQVILYNYGRALLTNREGEKGWAMYDDARISIFPHHNLRFPISVKPMWNGEALDNKTIYVYTSAGIGDDIFCARHLPELQRLGAKVIARPRKELTQFFRENDLKADIVDSSVLDSELEFDYQLPFMSLDRAFNTKIETIPCKQGYLKPNAKKVQVYKEKYFNNNCFKVGIVWSGSNSEPTRNVPLEYFSRFTSFGNLKLYSLQKGEAEKDLLDLPEGTEIINLGKTFSDFTDTAAAVENLDLLVSIDTSVLHLAGSMGKKAWALIPKRAGWCWRLEKETYPWYQSLKVFRQNIQNDWPEVIDRVYSDLEEQANSLF